MYSLSPGAITQVDSVKNNLRSGRLTRKHGAVGYFTTHCNNSYLLHYYREVLGTSLLLGAVCCSRHVVVLYTEIIRDFE